MLKSIPVLAAAMLLLAACGDGRNPGYVCMTDCAHYCEDGIKGDQCRADIQRQRRDRDEDDNTFYDANGYPHAAYHTNGAYDHDGYYDNNGYYHYY